ncbi:uncharacterized protein [Panulirus ornatus]|uniref:uncharacterized protein n=1 Tax=Panulirus ornatus TaxID=150431 RepID=UPI003A8BFB31
MMYWTIIVALVPWAAMGVAVGVPEELGCGRGCYCWLQNPAAREYRVICNETANQEVMLTEAVFEAAQEEMAYKTYVRVEAVASLVVKEGFIEQWRQYHSCALDIWSVNKLWLPETAPFLHGFHAKWKHVFAGVGLVNVTVDSLPAGLFSGKQSAGLRLTKCYVGRISSELLGNVKSLKYLEIRQSSVGLLEGPLGRKDLLVKGGTKGKYPVYVVSSTIGQVGKGALRLTATSKEDLVFHEVILGQLAAGAVNLFGRAKLVLDRCQVADMPQLAITLHNKTSVAITNSTLVLQRGALSNLPCSFYQHHIHSNQMLLLSEDGDHAPDPRNHTEDVDQVSSTRQRLVEMLEIVLHPTCVEDNLPPWLHRPSTTSLPPYPEEMRDSSLLKTGLYSFVGGSGIAIIMVFVLTCLLVRARRRRPITSRDNQVVVMSQLTPDTIYEDPAFLQAAPPPVPPPPTFQLSDTFPGKNGACSSGDDQDRDDCCTVSRPLMKAEENEYVLMLGSAGTTRGHTADATRGHTLGSAGTTRGHTADATRGHTLGRTDATVGTPQHPTGQAGPTPDM